MKTYMANPDKIERKWYVVDASEYTLGRLASEVAKVLRGKNKPEFTPHVDTGDYVIVVNAEKINVTGKKLNQKIYYNHSEYVGGMKETTLISLSGSSVRYQYKKCLILICDFKRSMEKVTAIKCRRMYLKHLKNITG